ncbi:ankyrin repeat domain-containing protein 53 isoform X2 [Cheilinus undulatus]|uniref:ankyrin repeat domain-containing protein 53 isoform X2 n=1 Tax=Cheilinus undulatus TaxID=241271 RepID=UPI001BD3D2F1|nr:ankyrin repeat domain-containing protein 53 isoform X2 [Cheilinus undulatus]
MFNVLLRNRQVTQKASSDGLVLSAAEGGSQEKLDAVVDIQGLSALHMACLYGQLATIRLLLDSRPGWISIRDQQGRQPIHMVLSSLSSPNTSSCVRHLLEHGADVHVTTNSGVTPLHLASSEGLLDCVKILLQAGADVLAQDSMGLTPLDFARIFCHRKVARYLRSFIWQRDKDKELRERMLVQALYRDLVDMVKLNDLNKKTLTNEKIAEWAKKKGFPPLKDFSPRVQLSKFHTKCLCSDQDSSNVKTTKEPPENHKERLKKPPASSSRPWSVYTVLGSERAPREEPDLRGSVTLWRDSSKKPSQYKTEWDSTPRSAPDLPLDVLERVLFPRAYPSRIDSLRHFEPQDIMEVQQRGYPQEESTSLWTEVVMHLVEVLEFGHY